MSSMKALVSALAAIAASACATAPPLPPEAGSKPFVVERDLAGATIAEGRFKAINGVDRPFTARLNGAWDGRVLTLVEHFEFADGQRDVKTWRLERLPDGAYSGVREDVVGVARGWIDGNAFRLEYDVRLPTAEGAQGRKVRFRDVMVNTEDGVVINRATVGYWGLRVGSVDLAIRRDPESQATMPDALDDLVSR
jgi:hypothetical protein